MPGSPTQNQGLPPLPNPIDQARAELKRLWGYSDFRPHQAAVVDSLLRRQDTLIILPTGSGKSICFQLPALLQPGLTLVVSPLIALMENQVKDLRQRHLPAAQFHSELPISERQQTLRALDQGKLRLLYLSPEALLSETIWQRLSNPTLQLNGLVIDEAHCLVQWGESFRPTYRRLGAVRPALLQVRSSGVRLPIAAFTATADPLVRQTLQQVLGLQNPTVVQHSPYRHNLELQVRTAWSPGHRRQQALSLIHSYPQQTGLIYTRSRTTCETLTAWLQDRGQPTAAYHAGLSAQKRRQVEQNWLSGEISTVVCTSAFGLGINKPDVRYVLHFHPSLTLPEYVQEIGRAGRDGQGALARMLISEPSGWLDPEDRQRRQFFVNQQRSQQQTALRLIHRLPRQGPVNAIIRQFREGAVALALLHSSGKLRWQDPFHYELCAPPSSQPQQSADQGLERMTQYLRTRQCRWQFILQTFGFQNALPLGQCGHCDRCRRAAD